MTPLAAIVFAASLSLTSATNYIFTTVNLPSNIVGRTDIGTSGGGNTSLRSEDIAFLWEAWEERRQTYQAGYADATNITSFIPTRSRSKDTMTLEGYGVADVTHDAPLTWPSGTGILSDDAMATAASGLSKRIAYNESWYTTLPAAIFSNSTEYVGFYVPTNAPSSPSNLLASTICDYGYKNIAAATWLGGWRRSGQTDNYSWSFDWTSTSDHFTWDALNRQFIDTSGSPNPATDHSDGVSEFGDLSDGWPIEYDLFCYKTDMAGFSTNNIYQSSKSWRTYTESITSGISGDAKFNIVLADGQEVEDVKAYIAVWFYHDRVIHDEDGTMDTTFIVNDIFALPVEVSRNGAACSAIYDLDAATAACLAYYGRRAPAPVALFGAFPDPEASHSISPEDSSHYTVAQAYANESLSLAPLGFLVYAKIKFRARLDSAPPTPNSN